MCWLHLRQHVLEEQQRSIVDPRRPGAESSREPQMVALIFYSPPYPLPLRAERRIGHQVIEATLIPRARMLVIAQRVTQLDTIGTHSPEHHIRAADRISLAIDLLAVNPDVSCAVTVGDLLLDRGENAPRTAGRIIDRLRYGRRQVSIVRSQNQTYHEPDHVLRGE